MPQRVVAVPGFTTREQVAYAGWLKGMSRTAAWGAARQALIDVGLGKLTERKSSELSGGQLRRVALAQALVHDAELVLLDEPTAGLDPNQYQRFLRVVSALQDRVQVVVSTHQIDDVGDTYEAVVLLDRGQCTFAGPVTEFLATVPEPAAASWSSAFAHRVEEED